MRKILLTAMLVFAVHSAYAGSSRVKNILIVYGSYAGSTAEMADSMKAALERAGHKAFVVPVSAQATDLSPYELVIIGGAVHGAKVHEKVLKFVAANRAALEKKPLAVFAACITITSAKADKRKAAEAYPDQIAAGLPVISRAVFAGKAPSSGWFANMMGKMILGITPGDYRDWKKIDAWAVTLPGLVQ